MNNDYCIIVQAAFSIDVSAKNYSEAIEKALEIARKAIVEDFKRAHLISLGYNSYIQLTNYND